MAGQDIPIPFFIKAIVTKSNLSFSSSTLHFNNVYLNQNSILPLIIKNGSFLPQKIGFVKVKNEIDIQPNDGFAILLPNESLEFSVNFSPSSITDYSFDLILYTNFDDKSVIKVLGKGVKSPLLIDKYNLSLRTTCPGEKVIESITIQNTHKQTICYEFILPDLRYSWLKISPYIFELKSLQKCRVEIEFFPPENILNENAKEWFSKLRYDILKEEKETNIYDNDNNCKKYDSNDNIEISLKIDNTNNINKSSNKNNNNKNNNNNNNGDDIIHNGDNDNKSSEILSAENVREPKTTFGVFTDFVEDSGIISVKNSFGQIQWLQNTKINLLNTVKSELNGSLIVDDNIEKQNIENNELENNLTEIDDDNLVEISEKNLITDSIIKIDPHNTIIKSIKNGYHNNSNDNNNNNVTANMKSKNKIDESKNLKKKNEIAKEGMTSNNIFAEENYSDLFENRSGIYSSWSVPIFMKVMKNSEEKKHENKTQIKTKNLNTSKSKEIIKYNFDDEFIFSDDNSDTFLPLFFSLETVVTDPQISCDTKTVNFGQIAIGKRCLKSIKISNNTNNMLQLITYGTNAVGPFSILNPIKDLNPHEIKKIVIEFSPTETGSFTEILEYQNREEIGGHRLRILLRAYGVAPYVTLTGLLPPPTSWGTSCKNGSGFLDFGNALVNDTVLKNFTVLNQSLFDVDVTLVRTSNGENSEKTISGLPIFSYRPESFLLLPGKTFSLNLTNFYQFLLIFLVVYIMLLSLLFLLLFLLGKFRLLFHVQSMVSYLCSIAFIFLFLTFYSFESLYMQLTIHLHTYSYIDSFIHSSIHSFIHLFIHSFIDLFIHPFINPFIHSSIHSSIHPFIHPFIHSFIRWSIY